MANVFSNVNGTNSNVFYIGGPRGIKIFIGNESNIGSELGTKGDVYISNEGNIFQKKTTTEWINISNISAEEVSYNGSTVKDTLDGIENALVIGPILLT
jgi:hypothetical protein